MERTNGALGMPTSVCRAVVAGSVGTAAALVVIGSGGTTGTVLPHAAFALSSPARLPGGLAVDHCGKIELVAGRKGQA